jgi:hypothetical protein
VLSVRGGFIGILNLATLIISNSSWNSLGKFFEIRKSLIKKMMILISVRKRVFDCMGEKLETTLHRRNIKNNL